MSLPMDLKNYQTRITPNLILKKAIKIARSKLVDAAAFLLILMILAATILTIVFAAAFAPVPKPLQVPVHKADMTKEVRI